MSQFRKTLTRIGGSAVALAAATALIMPGVASADNTEVPETPETSETESPSPSTGSLDLFAEFLPGDTLKAFKILTSPDFSFDEVSECVSEKFGLDDPGNDVFKIIIDCVLDSGDEAPEED